MEDKITKGSSGCESCVNYYVNNDGRNAKDCKLINWSLGHAITDPDLFACFLTVGAECKFFKEKEVK